MWRIIICLCLLLKRPENKTDAEWNLLHRQVCGFIRQWVDDNVLNHVSEEKHARSLWNKLEQLYARKTGNNKLFLIKKMMSLKYQDGTPMTDHLNTFQGIINQLAGMNIKFEEEVQGLWLLGTLPNSWETFRTSLFYTKHKLSWTNALIPLWWDKRKQCTTRFYPLLWEPNRNQFNRVTTIHPMQQEYEHQQFLAWKTFPNVRSKNHGTLRPLKPSTNIINGLHNSL